jgi:hypothetical protein
MQVRMLGNSSNYFPFSAAKSLVKYGALFWLTDCERGSPKPWTGQFY